MGRQPRRRKKHKNNVRSMHGSAAHILRGVANNTS
jgi:hypothetical protein